MRIISGKNRGKKISIPKNLPVRPTTDQSKEALFNIINNNYYFEDLKVNFRMSLHNMILQLIHKVFEHQGNFLALGEL